MMFKVQPTYDRVVVKPDQEKEISSGGIHLPQSTRNPSQAGRVVAVGPGRNIDAPGGYRVALSEHFKGTDDPGLAEALAALEAIRIVVERPTPFVKVGDRVLWGRHSGTTITVDEEEVHLLREDEILAVIESEPAEAAAPAE